ncbi:hypothetical protein CALCODRAFT_443812 [Calocera cornea HHB12733]|uniref:Myb-like domain-containing protein n=1 Tax=Calocera cornea HHB12733 TaxID=1353952 RepID=A0A165CK74_9BASI|nr:hypothetical protein CALCODRAFT_443812 [Calocera cornea HHB12733]
MRLLEKDKGKGRAAHSENTSGQGSPARKVFAQALPDGHNVGAGLETPIGEDGSASEDNKPSTKKARKLWTKEETQMLIDGCEAHGVGNWTTILNDSTYSFQSRSATDLKDRYGREMLCAVLSANSCPGSVPTSPKNIANTIRMPRPTSIVQEQVGQPLAVYTALSARSK